MIKGVNKKIVEINNTKSVYFEKAILYVRPNMSEIPAQILSNEAKNYLDSIAPMTVKPSRITAYRLILLTVAIAAIIGICYLLAIYI